MDAFTGLDAATNHWTITATQNYKERISYDANGNILNYSRNGNASTLNMDKLTYQYPKFENTQANIDAGVVGKMINNRLRYVHDDYNTAITEDIESQTTLTLAQVQAEKLPEQTSDNFSYDEIGNLTKDSKEGIINIAWNVYGKIKSIAKSNGSNISYTYDASGNRISKVVVPPSGGGGSTTTVYVRDASGNVMSVYTADPAVSSGNLVQSEVHLYGSSRLGIFEIKRNVQTLATTNYLNNINTFVRGNKFFELSNHLGNVLVTVSDKKLGHDPGNGIIDFYSADVVTANDYYPGGMLMPGRKYYSDKAVYGFNGKRKDNEMYGEANAYDFGDRIYNPRAVVWLSIDKLQAKYPGESPYLFVGGSPIVFIDLDGRDRIVTHIYKDKAGNIIDKAVVTVKDKNEIMSLRKESSSSIMGGGSSLVYTYDWHNIGQDVTHIIGDDGSEISSTTGKDYAIGEAIINTENNWKWWAKAKINGPEGGYGGIAFYGENGQGQETKIGSYDDLKMENIGALMAAFSALKTTLGAGPYKTLINKIANEKDITEKTYLFTKAAKAATSYYKLGIKAGHSLYEKFGIIDIKFMPNSIKCASCGETPHGLNDVMTDNKGNPAKVIIHNPSTYNNKTKKITPAKNDTIQVNN